MKKLALFLFLFAVSAYGQAPADPTAPTDLPSPNGGAFTGVLALPTTSGTIANKTNDVGDVITYSPTYDKFTYGNPVVYYEATNLPTGLTINATTGDITGTISDAVGSPLNVIVSKDLNGFAGQPDVDQVFTWTVNVPTLPDTGTFVAWYDFDDTNVGTGVVDEKADLHLTANNAPTYDQSGGVETGSSTAGTPGAYWNQNLLDSSFGNTDQDWSFAIRWRPHTSMSDGDRIFGGNGGRVYVDYHTAGIQGSISSSAVSSTVVPAVDGTWYNTVVTWETATNTTSISVNGETPVTSVGADSYNIGNYAIGGSGTSLTENVEIDYLAFASELWGQSEIDWFNAVASREWTDIETNKTETFDATGHDQIGWTSLNGTPDPDYTTTVLEGTESLYLPGNTNAALQVERFSVAKTGEQFYYCQIQLDQVPPVGDRGIIAGTNGATQWNIVVTTSGEFGILHGATSVTGVTTTLVGGTTYHLWWSYLEGSGADGSMSLYVSTTGTKPGSPEATTSAGTGTLHGTSVLFNADASEYDMIVDRFIIQDAEILSSP